MAKKYKTAAWTRKEGKNPKGGLNAKGRASAKKQGSNLKRPLKTGTSPRRVSFAARFAGMKGPMKDSKGNDVVENKDNQEEINVEMMDNVKLTSKENSKYKKLETELEKLKQENRELKRIEQSVPTKEKQDMNDLAKIESNKDIEVKKDNIYILCSFDNDENTYILNTNKKTFKLMDKLNVTPYALSFNEAYIVASNEDIELTINRVSGKAVLENKISKRGVCKLTNETKF